MAGHLQPREGYFAIVEIYFYFPHFIYLNLCQLFQLQIPKIIHPLVNLESTYSYFICAWLLVEIAFVHVSG